jgi:hypothetical protein
MYVGCEDVRWMELAQGRFQLQNLSIVLKLMFLQIRELVTYIQDKDETR